jgi:hypothetical protein
MGELGTSEKLKVAKELLANVFVDATTCSATSGMMYKYVTKAVETEEGDKGWVFQVILKEPAYKERILQEFKFKRPDNIDAKNMEYHVVISVLSQILQTAALTWNQLGMLLNSDLTLQATAKKVIKDGK